MGFFVGGSQKRHHDLYLLEMQNAKKSMAIKKKIALMSRLGVVRANAAHTMPEPSESSAALAIYYQVLWSLKLCLVCLFVCPKKKAREHSYMTSDVFRSFLTYLPTLIRYFTT